MDNNENKELLWNLLYEGGFFSNISNDKMKNVKDIFEYEIHNLSKVDDTLDNKNKLALENIVKNINKIHEPYTKETITLNKQNEFEQEHIKKQNEFDTLIQRQVPENIDFSLPQSENNEKIDNLLKKTLEDREKDLKFEHEPKKILIDKEDKKVSFNELDESISNLKEKPISLKTIDDKLKSIDDKLNHIIRHLGI